jgi:hypothetical protein
VLALCASAAGPARAAQEPAPAEQAPDERIRLELRVTTSGPGPMVAIDRGTSDGLRVGDEVVFRPRDGGIWRGTVARAGERSSTVDLVDPAFVPQPGPRGEALIPAARLQQAPKPPEKPPEKPGELPPHPGWKNADEEYEKGEPLLARVRAVRPEDRSKQYGGRLTLFADTTQTTEAERSDVILRMGSDLWVENPFGSGGTMQMDLSFEQYNFNTPDLDSTDETVYRVDRLSYALGGTRFQRDRFKVGRFLQHGMPEFGVVDGVEYERRLSNRHRVGASFGYMPLPNVDYDSFDDLQIAAFYEWTLDGRADLSIAAGAQKTWHDGRPDRELFVTRFDYLPDEGWDLRGATWIDLYKADDDKGAGLEVTQALLTTARRWKSDGIDLSYRHVAFPDLLRQEYVESIFEDLTDSAFDRVSASWYHTTVCDTRLRATTGVWKDEEEQGGDLELGLDVRDRWIDGDDAAIELFGVRGSYSTDAGMRVRWGLADDAGRWDFSYRLADRHMDEFSHESDDLWEHAVRGSRAMYLGDGWYTSLAGEARSFIEEFDFSLTLYVQKTF